MAKTYIIGHLKPDTDSVVAAMSLAYLYQVEDCFGYEEVEAVVTDELNPETSYLFEKYEVEAPRKITAADLGPDDQVVLVDHNEVDQRLEGLNEDQIIEVVDHHKINLNLNQPIYITFKPWGSTATIVSYLMTNNEVEPDEKLARMMLAAVLSDTVGLKSATTTDRDEKVVKTLAKQAGVKDVEAFTLEIFKAKSDISALSDEEIVKNDYKVFDFARKTYISQLETVEQASILADKKEALLSAMDQVKSKLGVELLFVAVTDILQVNTKLLVASDEEAKVAEAAFGGKVEAGVLDIGPKMSRKKEIAPAIEDHV